MQVNKLTIPGCYELLPNKFVDNRGSFVKTFHKKVFEEHNLNTYYEEEFYSSSAQGVIRGLHFQTPPHDHIKLIYCIEGEILDAFVDLRKGSPTYGQYELLKLNSDKANMVYLPEGIAHGFYVLSEKAITVYKTSRIYSPEHDTGILWSSANIPWPDTNPIISKRDQGFITLSEFNSPFTYEK